ncbi:MAG TPA: hypothetical protein VE710_05440 [Candidatus Bathyarchaeia archaeon]|nr:hypothetical protein [Candidatus Bathyarchaeia archaeon]
MRKIKIFLEYRCYPMWVYDEKDELLDNDLIDELKNDTEIDKMLLEIQSTYDELFEDNPIVFEYKGFTQESERKAFLQKVENAISLIKQKIGENYILENKVSI